MIIENITKEIKVKLQELITAIEFHSDMSKSFINKKTGEIVMLSSEAISMAEDNNTDYPDWQEEDINIAKHYLEAPDDFINLPSQFDVNEYRIMEDFAFSLENEKFTDKLIFALKGQGAFRRFKNTVLSLEIEKDWYQFRDTRYKEFALEWCKENGIGIEKES